MKFLSDAQRESFAKTNQKFGLGPQEFTAQLSEAELHALPKTRVMSSTGDSHFPRHYVSIGSIQEMRKLAGFDENFSPSKEGGEPHYPDPMPEADTEGLLVGLKSDLKPRVPEHIVARVEAAAQAYVCGDPKKVESYGTLINALKFPGRAAVFTGETLIVPDGTIHVIEGDDPVALNYGQIIVGKNASIVLRTASFIQSQTFTQKGDATLEASGATTFDFSAPPWTKPADIGAQGDIGGPQTSRGTDGQSHYDGGNCTNVCDRQPGNGPTGNDGGTGKTGTKGAPGNASPTGVHRLGLLTAPVTVIIGGSQGQQGGKGGKGGTGGAGGPPGSTANGCNNNVTIGVQGKGGKGGTGGIGGVGGNSGFVQIYYSWAGQGEGITVTTRSVAGGDPGERGDPGDGVGNLGPGELGTRGDQGPTPRFSLNRE